MRTIKFKLLKQTTLEIIESDARTFGELKDEIACNNSLNDKINFSESKFIERETKVEYGLIDEAILPPSDCLFFITPTKTKSGADILDINEVKGYNYLKLRSYCSKLNKENDANIDMRGNVYNIFKSYTKYLESNNKLSKVECNKSELSETTIDNDDVDIIKSILNNSIDIITKAIDKLKNITVSSDNIDYALDGVTFEELEAEAIDLKNKLQGL